MRLLTKTTFLYLLLMMVVFSFGGYTIYQNVKKAVALETDYALLYNFRLAKDGLEKGQQLEDLLSPKVHISKLIGVPTVDTTYVFADTIANHPQLRRLEHHRKLTTRRKIDNQVYEFVLLEVFIEEGDVLDGVISVISRLFLVLSLVILVFSFLISRKLLQPFQDILEKIGRFNLKSEEEIQLPETSTKEFKQLNHFIKKMTTKARQDYLTLKEFSENASHEMQTPIAIAKGKLELLLESEGLESKQLELIQSAQSSLSKLSKMGKSLSLLAKIENQEFSNQKPINFSNSVQNPIMDFKDICDLQGLKLEYKIDDNVGLKIDETLADILIGNLIKNAVHHNVKNGFIKVFLTNESFKIVNSGKEPAVPVEQFFERFRKSNQTSASLGLGLSIVKKICEVSDLTVQYTYSNQEHTLEVLFQK